jgi:hypothetical protein
MMPMGCSANARMMDHFFVEEARAFDHLFEQDFNNFEIPLRSCRDKRIALYRGFDRLEQTLLFE